jgi:hypothetical protein
MRERPQKLALFVLSKKLHGGLMRSAVHADEVTAAFPRHLSSSRHAMDWNVKCLEWSALL